MKLRLTRAVFSLPVLVACASTSAPPPEAPPTVIGTWQAPTYQAAANGNASVAGTTTLLMQRTTEETDAIGSLSVTLDLQYDTGGNFAGCHAKVALPGTYTTNGTGLHALLANGRTARERCANPSDDTMPTGPIVLDYDAGPMKAALTGSYSFSSGGKTLTINGLSFTRQ